MVSKQKWPQKEPFCCCGACTDYQLIDVPLLLGHGCALTTCHTSRMCHAVARSAALGRPSVRGWPRPQVEVPEYKSTLARSCSGWGAPCPHARPRLLCACLEDRGVVNLIA